jgi:hypothetical protein
MATNHQHLGVQNVEISWKCQIRNLKIASIIRPFGDDSPIPKTIPWFSHHASHVSAARCRKPRLPAQPSLRTSRGARAWRGAKGGSTKSCWLMRISPRFHRVFTMIYRLLTFDHQKKIYIYIIDEWMMVGWWSARGKINLPFYFWGFPIIHEKWKFRS